MALAAKLTLSVVVAVVMADFIACLLWWGLPRNNWTLEVDPWSRNAWLEVEQKMTDDDSKNRLTNSKLQTPNIFIKPKAAINPKSVVSVSPCVPISSHRTCFGRLQQLLGIESKSNKHLRFKPVPVVHRDLQTLDVSRHSNVYGSRP